MCAYLVSLASLESLVSLEPLVARSFSTLIAPEGEPPTLEGGQWFCPPTSELSAQYPPTRSVRNTERTSSVLDIRFSPEPKIPGDVESGRRHSLVINKLYHSSIEGVCVFDCVQSSAVELGSNFLHPLQSTCMEEFPTTNGYQPPCPLPLPPFSVEAPVKPALNGPVPVELLGMESRAHFADPEQCSSYVHSL